MRSAEEDNAVCRSEDVMLVGHPLSRSALCMYQRLGRNVFRDMYCPESDDLLLTRLTTMPPNEWQRNMIGFPVIPDSYGHMFRTRLDEVAQQEATYLSIGTKVCNEGMSMMVDPVP